MSDYQVQYLDRRVQYLEGKIQDWEKVIDILMADPTFMHTLGVKELKKNRNTNMTRPQNNSNQLDVLYSEKLDKPIWGS